MAMPCSSSTTKPLSKELHTVYLSLGSNMGDRRQHIIRAISEINERIGRVERQSDIIETEPWGFSSPHLFLNAVVCCLTPLSPRHLLHATQLIERRMGRRHKTQMETGRRSVIMGNELPPSPRPVYHDRIIDIDILLYDHIVVDEPDLHIPHPLMGERDFVMRPLLQILPPSLATGLLNTPQKQ